MTASASARRRRRIGLLTPFKELPGEYCDLVADAATPAVQWQVVTAARDSHDPADLGEMARLEPLADGLRRMSRWTPDAVMWACTSGSFVLGRAGSVEQCVALSALAGVPVRSTSIAFVAALRALGLESVAALASYPRPASDAFAAYLDEWGVAVSALVCLDHPGATSSETTTADDLREHLEALGRAGAETVLIPDTATWGFELAAAADPNGPRVITANQVTLWLAFALAGVSSDDARFGALRRQGAIDPVTGKELG